MLCPMESDGWGVQLVPFKDMVALNEWWITAQRCMWRQARNAL